jgi:excisionase family DNA binding protein
VSAGPTNGAGPALSIGIPPEFVEAIAQRAAEIVLERQGATDAAPYLTVDEAASYLRCRPKRIYDLCSQRRLPFVKDGSRTLLRRVDLDAYLEDSA